MTQTAIAASAMLVLSAGVAAACHPQGVIQKDVQDVTTSSATVKADTADTALNVHPGDTLVYHITVSNLATAQNDQMINTIITDSLPAGVQLVRADSFNVGTVAIKGSVQRTVTVKVTAKTAGLIRNEACFTGDSIDYKMPQKGCDVAYVKVIVPAPTPTPTPSPKPKPTPSPSCSPSPKPSMTPTPTPTPTGQVLSTQTQPALPDTGSALGGTAVGLGAMVSAGVAYIKSRKR